MPEVVDVEEEDVRALRGQLTSPFSNARRGRARAPPTPRARRLELVGERLELDLAAGRVRERVREQPVGEPRVAREQRAVEVRAVDAALPAALVAGRAVVAEARDHAAERLGALVEDRPAGVVLEARERAAPAHAQSSRTSPIMRRSPATVCSGSRPMPGQLGAGAVAVEAAEELVAAADGEERRAAVDRLAQRRRPWRRGRARRAPARGPGRRRRRRGRASGHVVAEPDRASRRARARARRRAPARTAMFPRSA